MEQAHQYLMWMQRKQMFSSIKENYGSWEERAFAEDASRILGGCMWPPRSYSCSFCKREFRSAQALGGHMNVHRRDRARLKQEQSSPPPPNDVDVSNHDEKVANDCSQKSLNVTSPPKSLESHNSNDQDRDSSSTNNNNNNVNIPSTFSMSSRVSTLSTQNTLCSSDRTFVSSSFNNSKNVQEPFRVPNAPNSSKQGVGKHTTTTTTTCSLGKGRVVNVETNLFMGFNSAINSRINYSISSSCGDEASSCKRLKGEVPTLSFLMKPCSSSSNEKNVIGHKYSSVSMEDIDLELRLGESPKVK